MIRIGIVGIGFMGMIHYLAAQRVKGVKVGAICSRDPKKRGGDWRGIQGAFDGLAGGGEEACSFESDRPIGCTGRRDGQQENERCVREPVHVYDPSAREFQKESLRRARKER